MDILTACTFAEGVVVAVKGAGVVVGGGTGGQFGIAAGRWKLLNHSSQSV